MSGVLRLLSWKGTLLTALLLLTGSAFAGEYIVKFKSEQDMRYSLYRAKSTFGKNTKASHFRGRLAKIFIKSKSKRDEAKQLVRLMNRPDVEYVVESFKLYAMERSDDEPNQEDPAEENPNQDPPAEERPVDDEPNQEDPNEDEPADDNPGEDEPNEDEPADENPVEEEPEEPAEPEPDRTKKQWALETIRANDAWGVAGSRREILVAVIDTGVDMKHEDLADRIYINSDEIAGNGIDDDGNGYIDDVSGWDFFGKDNDPDDQTSSRNKGHGTHCAGIIGAIQNTKGITGIAQNVRIMPLRFLGPNGSGDLMNAIKAIDYAIERKVDVISASWGARVPESRAKPLIEAIKRAEKAGILFVAAAANNGKSNDKDSVFPANTRATNVISVAASNVYDKKPRWSNYGEGRVHLSAPGEKIISTLPKNKYAALSGTSMATPLVAGLAALLLSETEQNADLKPAEIRSIMQATGTKVAIETACNCRIDAKAALERLASEEMLVVPLTATIGLKKEEQFSTWGETEGAITYELTNNEVATIDATGKILGLKKGRTQVIAKDAKGRVAKSMDIRVGLSGAPKLCPFHPVKCFFVCLVSWKKPWCIWNRNKLKKSADPIALKPEDLVSYR